MLNVTSESPTLVDSSALIDEILADLNLGDDPFPDPGRTLTDEENDQLDAYIRSHDLAYPGRETCPAPLNKFRPLCDTESNGNLHKEKVSDAGAADTCAVSPSSPSLCDPYTQSITRPITNVSKSSLTPSRCTPEGPENAVDDAAMRDDVFEQVCVMLEDLKRSDPTTQDSTSTATPSDPTSEASPVSSSAPANSAEAPIALHTLILSELDAYFDALAGEQLGHGPATSPTAVPVRFSPYESFPERLKRLEAERLAALREPTIKLPARWRALNSAQQYIVAARVPDATALTLNLSPAVEKVARAHADSLAYVVKRVNRYLAAAGLSRTPYALTLEISPNNRLHLHGVILVADVDPKNLKRALMKAGGKIAGRAGSRQMKLEPITNPDGWACYTGKDRKLTAKIIPGRRLVSLSQAMSRIARQHHEASLPAPKPRKRRKT